MSARGLSIDDLASSTRLRPSLLEQMAADDFLDTGGDVYARGHLRVIAGVLGLDADDLLACYDQLPGMQRPPAP
jgi:cytoskeletal protein RodZ